MKLFLHFPPLLLLLLTIQSIGFSQQKTEMSCGFDGSPTPEIEQFEQRLRHFFLDKNFQNEAQKGAAAAPQVVPVVVHVVHNGGAENIPDAQILKAIDHLNQAFAATGYFQNQGATVNAQIQFCLAKRDPNGNATTGITRTQSPLTEVEKEVQDLALKNLSRWNPSDYVNIWVVKEITSQSSGAGVAGYAYFPTSHGQPEDGMVCEARFFGKTPGEDGVLIHEMGHYFGLYHTFQGGCKNDNCALDGDRICDTPPDQGTHTGCPYNSCSTDVAPGSPFTSDVNDPTSNFMDYSPFACYHDFTAGQAVRMQAVLATERKSLLDSKGCGDPCSMPLAAMFSMPAAPFFAGQTINLTNQSTGATTFEWSANGVVFSNLENPTFTFPAVGNFEFTLKIGNSDANCSDKISKIALAECSVVADFTASKTLAELGETINFTNTSTGGGTVFQWFINGVLLGTGPVFDYTFSTAGEYTVILEASNGFCQTAQTLFVKVKNACDAQEISGKFLYNISNNNFYPYCITATSDGGLLTYGQFLQGSNQTAIVQKTNANGDIVWAKRIENAKQAYKMLDSPADQSCILAGQNKTGDIIFLMKMSAATGALIWKKDFSAVSTVNYSDLLLLPGGDIFLMFDRNKIARFLPDGSLVWARELGSANSGFFTSVARRPDGVILVVGSDQTGGVSNTSITFLDADGNVLDKKFLGPAASSQNTIFNDVVVNADNSFVVAGSSRPFAGNFTSQYGLVFKCEPSGTVIWAKKLGFQSASAHSANKNYIVKTSDGGYILWGAPIPSFENRLFMKIDGSGNMLWAREFSVPNLALGLTNLDENGSPGCWMSMNGGNRLLLAKVAGNGSAGGCNEISHTITSTDLAMSSKTETVQNQPFPLVLTNDQPVLTAMTFQKQTLCSQPLPCPEICDNGLDDDADGFVDCFDTADCDCSDDDDDCTVDQPQNQPISGKVQWDSKSQILATLSTPIVANLNPQVDSIPEIIVRLAGHDDRLMIFRGDGSNRDNPIVFFVPKDFNIFDEVSPLIVDIDANGSPEMIFSGRTSTIMVYKNYQEIQYSPFELWFETQNLPGFAPRQLSAADFDSDGVPEIYFGNRVLRFDFSSPASPSLTLALTGTGNTGHLYDGLSTAADVLSVSDCNGDPDCEGLELVAGTHIYSIDLDALDGDGLQIKIQRDLNLLEPGQNFGDGATQIADLNLDGTPEIIVKGPRQPIGQAQRGIYAWNKHGFVHFFPFGVQGSPMEVAPVTIGNFYDDRKSGFAQDFPELVSYAYVGSNNLFAFNLQAAAANPSAPFWWRGYTFDGSFNTFCTAFDFNGDGFLELVTRGDSALSVLYGGAAPFPQGVNPDTREWFRIEPGSITLKEGPVIADVDADGQAEIVFTCKLNNDPQPTSSKYPGRLRVVESAGMPWMSARPLWNQINYIGTHINDDLTVPKTQQKHWLEMGGVGSGKRPFNTHLVQASSLNPLATNKLKVPDVVISLDSARCNLLNMEAFFEICNQGSAELPAGTPITFYQGDPTQIAAAQLAPPLIFAEKLDIGACKKVMLSLGASYNLPVFAVINDDGSLPRPFDLKNDFPATDQPECNYENNIVQFQINYQPPTLDLGADIFLCKNSIVELAANPNFEKYRWQNGSTEPKFTAFGAGKYWVDAFDGCGFRQTDTIQVIENQVQTLDLPDVLKMCEGENTSLAAAGFAKYQWSPADSVSCPTCPTTEVLAKKSITLYLTAASGDCFVADSVHVEILPKPRLDLLANDGDCGTPASIAAQVSGNAPFQFLWENATTDSVLTTTQSGVYTVEVRDANGCAAADSAQVFIQNSMQASFTAIAPKCAGEPSGSLDLSIAGGSLPFVFSWSNGSASEDLINLQSGTYEVVATDANGCTATFSATLAEPPAIVLEIEKTDPKCAGESSGELDLTATGGTGAFNFSWSNFSASEDLSNLQSGTYEVMATDANGCTATFSATLAEPPAIVLEIEKTDPKCAGESSGELDLTATGGTGIFNFSWSNFSASEDLSNLQSGTYEVMATDANGCTFSKTVELTDPPALVLDFEKLDLNCPGDTGFVKILASGGTPPLQFLWSDGSTNVEINPTQSGTYAFTTTDANGCQISKSIEISTLGKPPILSLETDTLTCKKTTGQISATADQPGATFLWTSAGGFSSQNPSPQVFASGQFLVVATSAAGGCTAVAEVFVGLDTVAPVAKIADDLVEIPCAETTVNLSGAGSSSGQNFEIEWSATGGGAILSGEKTLEPTAGAAGFYHLSIENLTNGCTASDVVEVQSLGKPSAVELVVDSVKCAGEANGSIQILEVVGGLTPMTYSIDNQNFTSDLVFENLTAGAYFLTVRDSAGCVFQTEIPVFEPAPVSVFLTGDSLVTAGGAANLRAIVDAGAAQNLASILWSPPQFFSQQNLLEQQVALSENTLFSIEIKNENGCADGAEWLVEVDKGRKVFVPNILKINGLPENQFTIFGNSTVVKIRWLRVFDRWGDMVFENRNFAPNDPSVGWRGDLRGKNLNPQTLVWAAEIEFSDGTTEVFKGDLTVVR